MGSGRQVRGRRPPRVYWVRRGLVLAVSLLLVLGIGKVLGGTAADDPGASRAKVTSSAQAPQASASFGPVAPSGKLRSKAKAPLLPASGNCLDDQVSVSPSVPVAYATRPISIKLALQGTQPACNFDVSADSLVVKIMSGTDRIWSSQDCEQAIPRTEVVVRSGQPVEVAVTWNGRRSEEGCAGPQDWALFGFYHVYAAAQGSAAEDVQFEITRAPTVRITLTPKPKPKPKATASANVARPSTAPTRRASTPPSVSPRSKASTRP